MCGCTQLLPISIYREDFKQILFEDKPLPERFQVKFQLEVMICQRDLGDFGKLIKQKQLETWFL